MSVCKYGDMYIDAKGRMYCVQDAFDMGLSYKRLAMYASCDKHMSNARRIYVLPLTCVYGIFDMCLWCCKTYSQSR